METQCFLWGRNWILKYDVFGGLTITEYDHVIFVWCLCLESLAAGTCPVHLYGQVTGSKTGYLIVLLQWRDAWRCSFVLCSREVQFCKALYDRYLGYKRGSSVLSSLSNGGRAGWSCVETWHRMLQSSVRERGPRVRLSASVIGLL
jgi:hypothetical protein